MDWTGWFLPRTRRREPLESLSPPDPDDVARLEDLRAAGSRLELPHPVRCFLVFDSEAAARAFLESLDREAIRGQLRAEAEGGWTAIVVQTVVPTPGAITKVRETLTALAEVHEGRFLAWTAPPVY